MKTALLALAVAFACVSQAQPCIDYRDFLHQSGFYDIHTEHLTAQDDYLYVSTFTRLKCYDISDPSSLVFLGSVEIATGVGDIAVADGLAYIVTDSFDFETYWLTVVDVADPTAPKVIGTAELPTIGDDVAVSGDRVLVACGSDGVAVFDVGDPTTPQNLGAIPLTFVIGVAAADRWGFVAAGDSLHVLDLATAGLPEPVSSITIPGGATAIALTDMTAHVLGGQGLHVVDCSDPWHPARLGGVAISGSAHRVVTSEGVAHVAVSDRGLTTVDISDPWSPRLIGEILSARPARDVAAAGATVYLACFDWAPADLAGRGILVIDAGNPAGPPAIGSLDLGVTAHDLCVVDHLAYVLTDHAQQPLDVLRVIDVSQPDQPQPIHAVTLPNGAGRLAAVPPYMIVGYGAGKLAVFDVSDPAHMQHVSEIELSAELNIVVAAGQYAYAGVGIYLWGAIQGVDLTDPQAPSIFFDYYFMDPGAMGTDGTHLVVAGLHGEMSPNFMLVTFDISDAPNVQGGGVLYLGDNNPSRLAVAGHRVAMAGHSGGWYWPWPSLRYIDITDPEVPQLRGGAPLARFAGGVALADAVAYVGIGEGDYGALKVFSAADLSDVRILGGAQTSGPLHAITVRDELVYGLVWPSTLVILPAQCGETTAVGDRATESANTDLAVSIHPNPCNPRASISFRLTAPAWVEVGVYDVSGASVAVLAGRVFTAGEHTLVWNGCGAGGRNVASGVYFVRITAGDETATEKVVLVR